MGNFKNNQKMENLVNECKRIEEDSTYTAEAHYLLAASLSKKSSWFKSIPVIITGVSALALLLGSPNWVSWITLISSIIAIINIILEPESKAREHEFAAKSFTVLKHDARSLYESFKDFIDEKDIAVICDRAAGLAHSRHVCQYKRFECPQILESKDMVNRIIENLGKTYRIFEKKP